MGSSCSQIKRSQKARWKRRSYTKWLQSTSLLFWEVSTLLCFVTIHTRHGDEIYKVTRAVVKYFHPLWVVTIGFFSCEDMFFLLTLQYLAERRFKLTTGESNSEENCFAWGNRNSSRFPSTRESTSMVSTTVVMEETWLGPTVFYFALVNNDLRNPSFIFPKILSWHVSLPFSEMNFTRF